MTPPSNDTGLGDGTLETSGLEPQEMDVLFDALADEHRRCALTSLSDVGGEATFDALVADVARKLSTRTAGPGDPTDVATALYHVHLPKLESAGLVAEYDSDGTVALADRVENVPVEVLDSS